MCGDLGKTGMERPARALSRGWGKPRGHSEQDNTICTGFVSGARCRQTLSFARHRHRYRQERKGFSQIIGSLHFIVVLFLFVLTCSVSLRFIFTWTCQKLNPVLTVTLWRGHCSPPPQHTVNLFPFYSRPINLVPSLYCNVWDTSGPDLRRPHLQM
jgi:hypothetical protein